MGRVKEVVSVTEMKPEGLSGELQGVGAGRSGRSVG